MIRSANSNQSLSEKDKEDRISSPPPTGAGEVSAARQYERKEAELWRIVLLFLGLLATGMAGASWEGLRNLPLRLEGIPLGVVVLVGLFAVYVARRRQEINELRGFIRGMQQQSQAPASPDQVEHLLEVITRSQSGYRELIDSFDDLVFSIGLDGEIRACNRRFAELLDEPFAALVGRRLDEFVELAGSQGWETATKEFPRFLQERHWKGTLRLSLKKNDRQLFVDCAVRAILREGQVVAISGLARDVTHLRESEMRFSQLFEGLPVGVYFSTPEGQLLDANNAMVRMLGYKDREELLAAQAEDLYADPGERGRLNQDLEQRGTITDQELHLRRKDGTQIVCLDTSSVIRDSGGQAIRYQGTLVDITGRRAMEKQLHEEQEFARRLVSSFPDLIVALDAQMRYTFVSPNIKELLGYSPEELKGGLLGDRTAPDQRNKLTEFFRQMIDGERTYGTIEYKTLHSNGRERVFRAAASPMYDASGQVTGLVASSRDVTELKRLEEQVVQSEKLAVVGQMIAGVAHELNNPLTAILGISELLEEKTREEKDRHQLELIHQQARRAASIVQDLLIFSRPVVAGSACLDLNALLQQTLGLQEDSLRSSRISVDYLPATGLLPVSGDSRELVQVFVNLLRNAEQAIREIRESGSIRIRLGNSGGRVWVTVQDDGPGIRPEVVSRIFEPFFTTKAPGRGTGLGLSICHSVLKQYGGTIEATPAPGGGTVFTVSFPVARAEESAGEPAGAARKEATLSGISVLVVEDEAGIRELVQSGLSARGARVECVNSGEEALARLEGASAGPSEFDLVLCDMKMPGLAGTEFFERLRSRPQGWKRPFLFMTGDLLDPARVRAIEGSGARIIQKPFRMAELAAIVGEMTRPASA